MPASLPTRAHFAVEPIHSMIYFAPEGDEEYPKTGLRPGGMGYFASRSAPMGAVSSGVTAATFYNFNPVLVAKYLPRAWTLAEPGAVLEARLVVADRALRRLLGDDVVASPEVAELAELARAATADLTVCGRPLFAGHAGLDWPTEPHLVLWHAVSLLREYRGDGHVAALVGAGLSGLEALVSHGLTGKGFSDAAAKLTRGWSDEEWAAGIASLTERGLCDGTALTEAGIAARAAVEQATDAADTTAWATLGEERTARYLELGKAISRQIVEAGAFPANVFADTPGRS